MALIDFKVLPGIDKQNTDSEQSLDGLILTMFVLDITYQKKLVDGHHLLQIQS